MCNYIKRYNRINKETGKETWINEDLLDTLFQNMLKHKWKEKGVYNLEVEKEQLREDINTDEQLKEIDYNNKEQVQALKDVLKVKYPNTNKLWEL